MCFLHVCSTSLLKTLLEKGEIACNKQFLLFSWHFLPFRIINSPQFSSNLELSSLSSFSLEKSSICS